MWVARVGRGQSPTRWISEAAGARQSGAGERAWCLGCETTVRPDGGTAASVCSGLAGRRTPDMAVARPHLPDHLASPGNDPELRIRGRRFLPELHVGHGMDIGQAGQGHWYLK